MAQRYADDNDRSPLTWWKGHPIYATTLLVIVHVVAMVLVTLLTAGNQRPVLNALVFDSQAVFHQARIWQVVTYAFVNSPSIWFAIEMLLLFWFGRHLETFFGRRSFLRSYAILLLAAPVLLLLIGLGTPTMFAGSGAVHFAVFIAFATLYPSATDCWGIPAKWIAVVLLAISSLQDLAAHAFTHLLVLWATSALAYALVRLEQGRWSLPSLAFFQHKPKLRVVARPETTKKASKPKSEDASQVIDRLLDKITASGIQSLSEAERSQLENARQELLKRDR